MQTEVHLIAGLGKTGLSIARFLQRRNLPFILYDTRSSINNLETFTTEFPEAKVYFKELPLEEFNHIKSCIVSPGVPLDDAVIQKAFAKNIPVSGDIECFAHQVQAPVIAITGTNGKSTVTSMVGEMAKQAGFKVAVAGNIGEPVLSLIDDDHCYDLWVLELSSFQLELTYSLQTMVATILNVTPDHLDRHGTLEAYINAKQRIYKNSEILLYNRADPATEPKSGLSTTHKILSFGLDKPQQNAWGLVETSKGYALAYEDLIVIPTSAMALKGRHNWENALAAAAIAYAAGISLVVIRNVLKSYTGLPHRSQWVRTLDDVQWINDSKGTNIGATISAITGIGGNMQGKIVLIAGGLGKGADFSLLKSAVGEYVRAVILIGQDAHLIERALTSVVQLRHAKDMDEAVLFAKEEAHAGDVVLLSPACASQDMFTDFNQRGELFTDAVRAL